MRYIVFKCRKCEHHIYIENDDDAINKVKKLSNMECPNCGEEDENWMLVGFVKNFPGETK